MRCHTRSSNCPSFQSPWGLRAVPTLGLFSSSQARPRGGCRRQELPAAALREGAVISLLIFSFPLWAGNKVARNAAAARSESRFRLLNS